jgi:hypothetical protein
VLTEESPVPYTPFTQQLEGSWCVAADTIVAIILIGMVLSVVGNEN